MMITQDIRYIGVNDHQVDLFEGQYVVPNGMAYNSYVILDEKIAVMDTVDVHFGGEWLDNLAAELQGRTPDYLVVQLDVSIDLETDILWCVPMISYDGGYSYEGADTFFFCHGEGEGCDRELIK